MSARRSQILAVLPAYNEAASLPALMDRIDQVFLDERLEGCVLIVDDGSTDGTADVVREWQGRVEVLLESHDGNQGLPEAIRTGLRRAIELTEPNDVVVVMDADNSHTPGLIVRMTRGVREGADIVIASRFQADSRIRGVSTLRRLTGWGANFLFRVLVRGEGVKDFTCGYRAYRAGLLADVYRELGDDLIKERGFSCMPALLLRLLKRRPIVVEVPLILRYDMRGGPSKMNVPATILETFQLLGRHVLGRL